MEGWDLDPDNIARICALHHYALLSFFSFPSSPLEHLILLQYLELNISERSPRTIELILGTCNLYLGVRVPRATGLPTCVCEWR